jgi:hypothetical protein
MRSIEMPVRKKAEVGRQDIQSNCRLWPVKKRFYFQRRKTAALRVLHRNAAATNGQTLGFQGMTWFNRAIRPQPSSRMPTDMRISVINPMDVLLLSSDGGEGLLIVTPLVKWLTEMVD